jgi:hypothetical protein
VTVRWWVFGVLALVAAVLGYGAWRAHTHAYVDLRVKDHAGRTPNLLWADVKDARLVLQDAAGRVLAEATLELPYGEPRWTGPEGRAVDCRPQLANEAWQRCTEAHSRWVAGWVTHAQQARVTVGRCIVDSVAVRRQDYSDWWFWWVPLPHVGGTPHAYYTLEMHLDSARCAASSGL